jgi:hypothetical protein
MHRTRTLATATLVLIAALGWIAPSLATSETSPTQSWDQPKVTEIAKALATAANDLQLAFRREPADMMPSGDRRSRYAAKQDLRRLRSETRHLASQLEAGEGHDETIDIFLNIQSIAHSAAENGRRSRLTKPTFDRITVAREQLTQLAPYYGETWKPLMNTP